MESGRSSCDSRTGSVKGFELANREKEKGKGLGQAPLPVAAVVAKVTPEEDPFMVKLDPSDPSHPKVRTTPPFFCGRPGSAEQLWTERV